MSVARKSRHAPRSDSLSDLTFSEIHRRVAWGMVVLLAGTGIDSCNHQSFTQGGRHLSIPSSGSNLWISECHSFLTPFLFRHLFCFDDNYAVRVAYLRATG